LDAQANASIWLLGEDRWRALVGKNSHRTAFQILKDREFGTEAFDFEKAVIHDPMGRGHAPFLDLLPSTYKMMEGEEILWRIHVDFPVTQIIKRKIQVHLSSYDIVIIDCPPNTYRITQNAIAMSKYIYVPAIPDYLSLVGFRELVNRLYHLGGVLGVGTLIPIKGVIANGYRVNVTESTTGIEQLKLAITQLKNQGKIIPNCKLLEPLISYSTAVPTAARRHLPVSGLKTQQSARVSEQYYALAKNFI
jgi:chromosome partitioning protein